MAKVIEFTEEEHDFIYNQLNSSKDYFEDVLRKGLDAKDDREIDRGIRGRNLCQSGMTKILLAKKV